MLYRYFNCPTTCASCGIRPKSGTQFTRHSPNATLVNELLHKGCGIDSMNDDACICFGCYKCHLAIIKSFEEESSSSDIHLRDLIEIWEHKISDKTADNLTRAVLHAVLYVAHELTNQRAVLLPHVSKIFLQAYGQIKTHCQDHEDILEGAEGTVTFSSKWLLRQLVGYLHTHGLQMCTQEIWNYTFQKEGRSIDQLVMGLCISRNIILLWFL